jgi:uncharacterized protein (TIGR03083 family)
VLARPYRPIGGVHGMEANNLRRAEEHVANAQAPQNQVRAVGLVIRAQLGAIGEELRALDAAGWDAPSWCEGWAIKDVSAHMAESNDRFYRIVSAALEGAPVPDFTAAERAERQAAVKGQGSAEIVRQLQARGNATFDLLEGASVEALARTVTVPAGRLTLLEVAPQRLNECTLHSWDIRYARDRDTTLDEAAVPFLLDRVIAAAPRFGGRGAAGASGATYHIQLGGPSADAVTLAVADGVVTATRGASDRADVTLRMPAEAFIRLVWGRLDLVGAIDAGTVEVEGSRDQAHDLGRLFRPG